jgi:hypothetical protein
MKFRLLIAVAVILTMATAGCSSENADEGTADSGATIESYISAYNEGDLDAVMTHFTQESVIVGHPTDFDPQADDIYQIERLHKEDLRFDETYVVSNLVVSSDTVTWDSVWECEYTTCISAERSSAVRQTGRYQWRAHPERRPR